ncbi:ABC transporter permease [Bifidobacterium aquikefiricola]|uniref:ABC transporter permease n=1 Tax=Bifidobacterium aquikefiricola TaxID=3059038 RepID=A0AB39U4R5_9BIFI
MTTLIRLELKKNNIRPYIISAVCITLAMFGFVYLFAGVSDEELEDYALIVALVSCLIMASYAILGGVMFARFAVDEYKGKRAMLLFSYPVSRSRVLLAKTLLVCGFVFASTLATSCTVFASFQFSETFAPLVHDNATNTILSIAMTIAVINGIQAVTISMISLMLGLWKESEPTTIVSTVIITSLMANFVSELILTGTMNSIAQQVALTVAFLLVAAGAFALSSKRVNAIEI